MRQIRSVWFPSNRSEIITGKSRSCQHQALSSEHLHDPLDVVQDDGGLHGHAGHAHRQAGLLLQVVYLSKPCQRGSVNISSTKAAHWTVKNTAHTFEVS